MDENSNYTKKQMHRYFMLSGAKDGLALSEAYLKKEKTSEAWLAGDVQMTVGGLGV